MSPRKVRLIADNVRGMDVIAADAQLEHLARAAALPLRKLIASAAANGEHNLGLDRANLFIERVFVNQGPTLKRFRPRAFGRAATIRKRTSHVTVVLDERVPSSPEVRSEKVRARAVAAPKVVADRTAAVREVGGSGADEAPAGKVREQSRQQSGTSSASKQRGFFNRFLSNRRSGER